MSCLVKRDEQLELGILIFARMSWSIVCTSSQVSIHVASPMMVLLIIDSDGMLDSEDFPASHFFGWIMIIISNLLLIIVWLSCLLLEEDGMGDTYRYVRCTPLKSNREPPKKRGFVRCISCSLRGQNPETTMSTNTHPRTCGEACIAIAHPV